jgi:pyruvate kinase
VGQNRVLEFYRANQPTTASEAVATVVEQALQTVPCDTVFVPTQTGTTARMLSRFKPAVWIVAASHRHEVCQGLAFSYGVWPVEADADPADWWDFAGRWMDAHGIEGRRRAMLVSGPSAAHPDATHRLEFKRLSI